MSTRHRKGRLIVSALLLLTTLSLNAQVSNRNYVLATGGVVAANASTHLAGTLGQPIVGFATARGGLLSQGFWFAAERNAHSEVESPLVSAAPQFRCIPNPVSKLATVHVILPKAEEITLELHDLLGRKVLVLSETKRDAGRFALEFDVEGLSAGHYRLVLTTGTDRHSLPVQIVQ